MERDEKELIARALEMVKAAYAPYSHFHVGAAVRAASGRIYAGANVENASYGASCCAERNAIARAVVAGERRIAAIAIAGGREGVITGFCAPCGICRQVMREFADPKALEIYLVKSPTDYRVFTLEDLLPESFGPADVVSHA